MSKKIDERVVEMQFDNKQFEREVSTTMSTIDKLKEKLKFSGAADGLENVGKAAKKVDMSGLGAGVDTIQMKFSALEVMAVTALANITNSAVNAGKRMVSALTLDPVISGFQEYETQINAIQTILANTQSKGSTLEDVTAALDELNKYADQTIYNFTEMTRNIGTFTAAGVDLDMAVSSIKGIANLAAVSGSNATQASTAMYQLSQAIAAGKVQLMDWNSVVNAGMGGELFQNALKRTATAFGTNVDALIEKYGSFRESLTKGGWLTAEVLTETLTQLSGAYSEADLIAQGFTQSQAKEIVQLAETAVGAATDVKTFTQLIDTLKESLQSGWTQTWEIILGDFEEAKTLWTEVSDVFGGIIQSSADARNSLLEGALGGTSKWDELIAKVNEAGISTEQFEAQLKKTAESSGAVKGSVDDLIEKYGSLSGAFAAGALPISVIIDTIKSFAKNIDSATKPVQVATDQLEYFNDVVTKVIRGDFGNGQVRIEALTKAGYDNVTVQKLVNKVWERNGYTWSDTTISAEELTSVISDLSTEEIQSIGYTEEQAKKLKELAKQAEETGTPINELINSLNKPSGRELLIDTFRNALTGLISVCKAVKNAWQNAFPPMTSEQLYNIIDAIHSFSEYLVPTEETINKLTRTLKGLFAIIDIITTITGGAFKIAFKVLTTILGMADLDILSVTAHLGDMIVGFRDFMFSNEVVTASIEALSSGLIWLVTTVKDLVTAFLELPAVQEAITKLVDKLKEMKEVGTDAIKGLQNGLKEGIYSIPQILVQIGKAILEAIKGVLGIHSPSTEMHEVGKNTVQGFVNGVKDGTSGAVTAVKEFGSKCLEAFKNIPWGTVVAAGVSVALLLIVKNLVGAISALTAPLEGLGDLLSGAGKVLDKSAKQIAKVFKGIANVLNAKAFSMRLDAIKGLAIGLALLAGSIYLLAQIETTRLWATIGAMAALATIVGVLAVAVGKFGPKETLSFSGFALGVVGISIGLLVMSAALKKLNTINPENLNATLIAFATIITSLALIIAAYGQLVSDQASKNISKLGTMMLKLSVSLLLMVTVVKLISKLSEDEITKGAVGITAFIGVITLLSLITRVSGKNTDKLGSTMIKLSIAMALLVGIVKLISGLSEEEIVRGGMALLAFTSIIAVLATITKLGGKEMPKLSGVLIAMSTSMLLMAAVVKIMAGMSVEDIVKGMTVVTAFTGIIALLVSIVKLAGKDTPKIALTLLAMSTSIAILAGVAIMLSLIDIGGLAKGVVAIGFLSAFMAGMVFVTKYAQDVKGTLVVLTVTIGVLAAAIAALSFIDPAKLAGATAALSIVMGMFALMVKSSAAVTTSMGTMIVMVAAVGILAGILYVLSGLPVESALATSASLSLLLLSLAASMKIIGTVGKIGPSTIASLAVMSLTVAGLAGLITILAPLDIGSTLETVASLSTLLIGLSAACVILAGVGKIGAGAALQGALALDGVILIVGGLMVAIGALTAYFPQLESFLDNGIVMLEKIGYGLGSFIGNIIGGLLGGMSSGLPEIGTNLSSFMENLTPFIEGAKSIDGTALKGVTSLAAMIAIISAAEIVSGVASFITGGSSMTEFADQLVPFGEAMAEFSETISGRIDSESVTAAANAGLTLANLSTSLPKEGGLLQDFFGQNQDLQTFGTQLVAFGQAIVNFSQTVSGQIDSASVEAASNAGLTLSNLATSLPKQNGWMQKLFGNQDLEVFGTQLVAFGQAIVNFSQTVSGKIDSDSVEAATNAGMLLANLSSSLPKQDGWMQNIFGSQDLEVFGTQLTAFGKAIVDFSQTVAGNVDESAVTASTNAGMAISALANTLPKQGGFAQAIFGEQDMSVFGTQLVSFGQSFETYSNHMKNVDSGILATTTSAAESVVKLASSLPKDGWFSNNTNLSDFGGDLSAFGAKFAEYYSYIGGINPATLNASISSLSRLVGLARDMSGLDTSGMSSFGKALNDLSKASIDEFVNSFANAGPRVGQAVTGMINSMANSVNASKASITSAFTVLIDTSLLSINSKASAFSLAGQTLMIQFTTGVRISQPTAVMTFTTMITTITTSLMGQYSQFTMIGQTLVSMLITGAQANANGLANAFITPINNALVMIRGYYQQFYNAGMYLDQGMAEGIASNASVVAQKAADVARQAYEAAMQELDAHSPSRLFMKVGSYVALGFANGITNDGDAVEDSASEMARNALDTTKNAIAMIADAVDSNIDAQPTIRPVLDLSDVESKAGLLNTLFSSNQAMSIGSRMNARSNASEIQNGDSTPQSAPVYKFEQNNYSPKALSNIEIYRQTKNLFSAMERMVKV